MVSVQQLRRQLEKGNHIWSSRNIVGNIIKNCFQFIMFPFQHILSYSSHLFNVTERFFFVYIFLYILMMVLGHRIKRKAHCGGVESFLPESDQLSTWTFLRCCNTTKEVCLRIPPGGYGDFSPCPAHIILEGPATKQTN